jgi:hypothetical protein
MKKLQAGFCFTCQIYGTEPRKSFFFFFKKKKESKESALLEHILCNIFNVNQLKSINLTQYRDLRCMCDSKRREDHSPEGSASTSPSVTIPFEAKPGIPKKPWLSDVMSAQLNCILLIETQTQNT